MVPDASTIAVLINPTNPDTEDEAKDIEQAARGLGLQILVVRASNADEINAAFETLLQKGARALIVGTDILLSSQRIQIAVRAAR
jgi:putative ABC transport system substrate-binding protein